MPNQIRPLLLAVVMGIAASACEPVERVTIHTTNLAEVRQEDREFKIDAALPTREGTVVTTGVGLNLLATVASPTSGGVTLQATDVHWVGDTLYASYNVRDEQFLGAIQVIDVTNRRRPVVVAEAIFPATDINRIRASGDQLFVAAADRVLGGTFERFRYRDGEFTHLGYNQVGSYSATFLELEDYLVHVSYGDEDGGVKTFDVSGDIPVLVDEVTEHDARWVGATTTGGLACVAGSPGRLTTMEDDGTVTGTEFVDGARIGAPTWATQRGDRLYLSSDDAGLLIYDLRTLEELGRLATTGTSNGSELAVDGRLAFLANGEEGIVVADLLSPADPVTLATLDVSGDAGSANAVSVHGEYIALADGLGGVKILHYHRTVDTSSGDCDGDGIRDSVDLDDDNDGIFDEDDAEPCNPDIACDPDLDQIDYSGRFVGDFYNLPCDHPDVEGPVTGLVLGTLPSDYDWFDDEYFVFSYERDELIMSYSQNYFPVDTGLCGDPFHFAVHWYTTLIVSEAGIYTFEMGSDDDSWLFIDGELATDLGGIHAIRRTSSDVYLEAGPHKFDIYFAERHVVQSGLEFELVGQPEGSMVDFIQHVCLDPDEDTDGDGLINSEDIAPLVDPSID